MAAIADFLARQVAGRPASLGPLDSSAAAILGYRASQAVDLVAVRVEGLAAVPAESPFLVPHLRQKWLADMPIALKTAKPD